MRRTHTKRQRPTASRLQAVAAGFFTGEIVLFQLLAIAVSLGLSWFGFATARRFVHDKLKFVDGAQTMKASVIAGLIAWAVLMPFTFFPFIGFGTAVVFGLSVGMGVRAGQKDIKYGRITNGL